MSTFRMSFALRAPLVRSAASRSAVTTRSFQTSRSMAAGKESALQHEGRADEIEHHKQDQLKKQKEGKGHWKDELASDSESIVKADRGDTQDAKKSIKELQDETAKLAQQQKEGEQKKA